MLKDSREMTTIEEFTKRNSVQFKAKKIVNGCEVHLLQNLIKYGGKKLALSFSDEQGVKMSHF